MTRAESRDMGHFHTCLQRTHPRDPYWRLLLQDIGLRTSQHQYKFLSGTAKPLLKGLSQCPE